MTRDRLAERGFGATREAALLYERGRPPYARELVPALAEEFGLNESSRVLDLAAGTGQLARLFVPRVGSVVTVEPSRAMRDLIRELHVGVEALEGTAEQIPLADESVDFAVVGNAFHWFDGPAALAELARVTRRGGGLAIVWNTGVASRPPADKLDAFVQALRSRATVPRHRRNDSNAWQAHLEFAKGWTRPFRTRAFMHERELDREALVAYLGSLAFVAAMADDERHDALDRMRALAPDRSTVLLRTEAFTTTARPTR